MITEDMVRSGIREHLITFIVDPNMGSGKRELIYPKGERVWVGYYNTNHELILILTSKESRDYYYLYELVDGGFKKLGRARSPVELEERFEVNKRLVVTP